ncbi:hypothetical protein GC176_04540 [bacterium]|nr:hypothetical protein [bacterium]
MCRIVLCCLVTAFVLVGAEPVSAQKLQTWTRDLGMQRGDTLAFSPDANLLAVCDSSRGPLEVQIWGVKKQVKQYVLKSSGFRDFKQLIFSPDAKTLVGTDGDAAFSIWDVPTQTLRAIVRQREDDCRQILFSSDGKWIVSGATAEPALGVWDATTGELRKDVEIDPDVSKRFSSFNDRTKLSDFFKEEVHDVTFAGDKKVVTAGRNGTIGYWDISSKIRIVGLEQQRTGPLIAVTASENGQSLAAIGLSGAFVWSLTKSRTARGFPINGDFVYGTRAEFSADGKLLIVVGRADTEKRTGAIRVWDVKTRRGVWMTSTQTAVTHFAWCPNKKLLAYADDQGKTHVVDLNTKNETGTIDLTGRMAWSPNGEILAVAGRPVKLVYFEEP